MSNTARWIIAILLVLFGIAAALSTIFGGVFSTVACVKVPPDWVYYIVILSGFITLAAVVTSAVMLVRRARGARILVVLTLGVVFSCAGYGLYFYLLGNYC